MSKLRRNIFVVLFYLAISLFFFRGILTSPGLIIGGDWSLPETFSQMHNFMTSGSSLWRYTESLFGSQATHLNDYPFRLLVGLLPTINISGGVLNKFLLIFLFTLAGFSMYTYCRFLNLKAIVSILGGFFFITTPLFFNYAIMGWQHVLLSLALLPFALITFTKSIKEQKVHYAIITGFLYLIAFWQSQSLIWYPLAFILLSFFIVRSPRELISTIKSLVIIFLILFLMNIQWLLPLLIDPSKVISQAVSHYDIARFALRLSNINLLRLWGSLYNYQYESAFPSSLLFITFIPPAVAYLAFILKKDRVVLFFTLFSLLPLIFFIGRELFQYVPFSNVIRDSSRFITLSTLAYSVLIAMTFDALFSRENKPSSNRLKIIGYKNIVGYILVVLIVLNSYPFWTGELYGTPKHSYDIRLRTLEFPSEYNAVENMLAKEKGSYKALYLPLGGRLDLLYDERFHGAHREITDIFGYFAPVPGVIGISDKGIGIAQDFAQILQLNINSNESLYLSDLLNLANIKYVIIRLNTYLGPPGQPWMKEITYKLGREDSFRNIQEINSIVVFENTKVLPHIYASPDTTGL